MNWTYGVQVIASLLGWAVVGWAVRYISNRLVKGRGQ